MHIYFNNIEGSTAEEIKKFMQDLKIKAMHNFDILVVELDENSLREACDIHNVTLNDIRKTCSIGDIADKVVLVTNNKQVRILKNKY